MEKFIPIDLIDLDDFEFCISKPLNNDDLQQSIERYGLIKPIVLLKDKDSKKYKVVFGFNRLNIIRKQNSQFDIKAEVHEDFSLNWYLNELLLKSYDNRISPVSKIKAIDVILKKVSSLNLARISFLNIPDYFLQKEVIKRLNSFDTNILNYLNVKSVGFKEIKNILRLNMDALEIIKKIIELVNPRINIFRDLLTLIYDIFRNEKKEEEIKLLFFKGFEENIDDGFIYETIFKIRNPEYSQFKNTSENIVNRLKKIGIELKFPQFFEGNSANLIFKVNKQDNGKSFLKSLSSIKEDDVVEILKFL